MKLTDLLPKKIKVIAFDIAIHQWESKEANALQRWGQFNADEMVIRIDKSLNPIKMIDVLVHEINHAIYWAYGMEDEDKEERIVGMFATAWTQVYRDNPELLEFIMEALKRGQENEAN